MIAGGKKAKHQQLITEKHKKPCSTAQRESFTKNTEITTTTTKYEHQNEIVLIKFDKVLINNVLIKYKNEMQHFVSGFFLERTDNCVDCFFLLE